MPIVAEQYAFVIGVDTHAATHSFALINATNVSFATRMGPPVGHQLWTTCLAHWG